MDRQSITLSDSEITRQIFGSADSNLRYIENEFNVRIFNRQDSDSTGDTLVIEGEEENTEKACSAIYHLVDLIKANGELNDQNLEYTVSTVKEGKKGELSYLKDNFCFITGAGKMIKPKTFGQKEYLDLISKKTLVFGVGPAGTGKTFLAVLMAVKALKEKSVSHIILTRPAVEAGERLGYLPGDLQSKIDPYLRPLYDSLYELIGFESTMKHIEKMTIELAPLAYMRGRTLNNAFIILDEAQNTTREQMKMFLTRLGYGSKVVVTGDLSQTDLPNKGSSGLSHAIRILKGIDDIGIYRFSEKDVVRHKLVRQIISAYDKSEVKNNDRQT